MHLPIPVTLGEIRKCVFYLFVHWGILPHFKTSTLWIIILYSYISIAGSPVQNQTASSSGGSSRILRLFGVNLECQQQQDDESEPSTPDGSSLSSRGPTHHQFYPNPTNAYYGDHRHRVSQLAFSQSWIDSSTANIIIIFDYYCVISLFI